MTDFLLSQCFIADICLFCSAFFPSIVFILQWSTCWCLVDCNFIILMSSDSICSKIWISSTS
jgi:hypothetical protein